MSECTHNHDHPPCFRECFNECAKCPLDEKCHPMKVTLTLKSGTVVKAIDVGFDEFLGIIIFLENEMVENYKVEQVQRLEVDFD